MRILISNDDGVFAEGIQALAKEAARQERSLKTHLEMKTLSEEFSSPNMLPSSKNIKRRNIAQGEIQTVGDLGFLPFQIQRFQILCNSDSSGSKFYAILIPNLYSVAKSMRFCDSIARIAHACIVGMWF